VLLENGERIVQNIGQEAVDVYLFLSKEFGRPPVTKNHVFQLMYRAFYAMDNAGLTDQFKSAYFECMERNRSSLELDLASIVRKLGNIPNRRGYNTLQFSFATKLAHTVNFKYPIYDSEVAQLFQFRPPWNKCFEMRLKGYLTFYQSLRQFVERTVGNGTLQTLIDLFEETYSPAASVPPVKILDFVFWSAGRLKHSVEPLEYHQGV
jgi:hypothetical protein